MAEEETPPPELLYLVAGTQFSGQKTWQATATIEEAFILGATWRSDKVRDITIAQIIPYTAVIKITVGEQVIELPVPEVGG